MYIINSKGFTLIELLVVISIIGLLSSVVLASLNSARIKAKDAAIKQGVREFDKLMLLEYHDTGSYANLRSCDWVPYNTPNPPQDCSSMFSGTYAVQARNICNNILSNAKPVWGTQANNSYAVFICNAVGGNQKYSIMVSLNKGNWFCSGSSGTSDNVSYWLSRLDGSDIQSNSSRWSESPIGCYYNP